MEEAIKHRLGFLDIDDSTRSHIRTGKRVLDPHLDSILASFYDRILAEPTLRKMFADEESIERARSAQKRHWSVDMLGGEFDSAYLEKVDRIGIAHARIGLSPQWYIGGYCHVVERFVDTILKDESVGRDSVSDVIRAILKIVFLDIDLVVHSYLGVKNESMRSILRRATAFNRDAEKLCLGIRASADEVLGTLDAPSGQPDPQTRDQLKQQVDELLRTVASLKRRLNDSQTQDRLYIAEQAAALPKASELGLMGRIKFVLFGDASQK